MQKRRMWPVLLGAALLSAPPLVARAPRGSAPAGEESHAPARPGASRPPPFARLVSALAHRRTLAAPTVGVEAVNSGAVVERDLCLTLALGDAAAAECGDLRLAHALPTLRTLNRARTPVLLYNSQHASPYPLVAAEVTVPAGTDRIEAVLAVNGVRRAGKSWSWAPGAGSTRRVVLGYDAGEDRTGIYPYTLTVTAYSGSTASPAGSAAGRLAVVNRRYSPFGAGWWVGGVEQLVVDRCGKPMYWIGGDGSVREYTTTDCTKGWAAPSLDRPDSLKWNAPLKLYERILPGGVRVQFNAQGQHVATVNRLGQATRFAYLGERLASIAAPPAGRGRSYEFRYDAEGFLQEVAAPGADTTLRVTRVRMQPVGTGRARRVTEIVDPSRDTVRFGYLGASALRVTSRTDRLGYTTAYAYDDGQKVRESRLDPGRDALGAAQPVIVRTLASLESLGMQAPVDTAAARTLYDGPRGAETDRSGQTVTIGDTVAFWLDRYGSPRRIVDALGHETRLSRADSAPDAQGIRRARYPALVTRIEYPRMAAHQDARQVVVATYDGRGHLETQTDSSVQRPCADGTTAYPTTRYAWNTQWDAVQRIELPCGEVTTFGYDEHGNRTWQQTGPDERRRVFYDYNPLGDGNGGGNGAGLISAIRAPSGKDGALQQQSIEYDALGNVSATRTPGGRSTLSLKDKLGRDTLIVSPIEDGGQPQGRDALLRNPQTLRQRIRYDVQDRDTLTVTIGPRLEYVGRSRYTQYSPAETLLVRKFYDRESGMDSLSRSSRPDSGRVGTLTTRWMRDAAGRTLAETAPDKKRDVTRYDAAGNAVRQVTRRGDTLRMEYDALGRLTHRSVPELLSGSVQRTYNQQTWDFPGYAIPGEEADFAYDEMGRMRSAVNADAEVRRGYALDGALTADTLRIRHYDGSAFHPYVIRAEYDREGRRIGLVHPDSIRPATGIDTQRYAYDAQTGQLETVTDLSGTVHRYTYDLAGRLQKLTRDGSPEEYFYDEEGNLAKRVDGALHRDTMFYDARGKKVRSIGLTDSASYHYSGIGALDYASLQHYSTGGTEEIYRSDALGNLYRKEVTGNDILRAVTDTDSEVENYYYQNGRLYGQFTSYVGEAFQGSQMEYDAAGNLVRKVEARPVLLRYQVKVDRSGPVTFEGDKAGATFLSETRLHYGADQRLRIADRKTCYFIVYETQCSTTRLPLGDAERGALEEYRYDALGRRVLVRTRTDPLCQARCTNALRRVVWDGDQMLYEISAPGGDNANAAEMERDVGNHRDWHFTQDHFPYGRVVYAHGADLDHPLSLIRMEYDDSLPGPVLVIPHMNQAQAYDTATFSDNRCREYRALKPQVIPTADPDSAYEIKQHCVLVDWPGPSLTATREKHSALGSISWMGSLIDEKRDASGQMYMRNRYYDPSTGRFTQEDPIGLAGGLNVYGFANGDPVGYSDPYGLRAEGDTVIVGVRRLKGLGRFFGNHAAVMVASGGTRQLGELLNNEGTKEIDVRTNPSKEDLALYKWTVIKTPKGMSDAEFDEATINSFNTQAKKEGGTPYHFYGSTNSNHFVWSVVTGAGGQMPWHGDLYWGFTPGYCGGDVFNGASRGNQCFTP